jgi:hypothetical protein
LFWQRFEDFRELRHHHRLSPACPSTSRTSSGVHP